MGCPDSELSILLTDDEEIRELNRDFRGIDEPTDVLAFAAAESEDASLNPQFLGDVAISLERAEQQAAEEGLARHKRLSADILEGDEGRVPDNQINTSDAINGLPTSDVEWTVTDEVTFLILHGILHCMGYDHHDETGEYEMRIMERKLMDLVRSRRSAKAGLIR